MPKDKDESDKVEKMTERTPAHRPASESTVSRTKAATSSVDLSEALRSVEAEVGGRWGEEKFNDGVRAAVAALRAKLNVTEEPTPAASTEAP